MDTSTEQPVKIDRRKVPKPWLEQYQFKPGNHFAKEAAKGKKNFATAWSFKVALVKALEKRSKSEQRNIMEMIADKLIDRALERNLDAIREIADRIDGKSTQQTNITGTVNHVREFLKDAADLERAMLEVNKHRALTAPEDVIDVEQACSVVASRP
jgi:hypothetical protein